MILRVIQGIGIVSIFVATIIGAWSNDTKTIFICAGVAWVSMGAVWICGRLARR